MTKPVTTTFVFTMDDVYAVFALSLQEAKDMIHAIAKEDKRMKPITKLKLQREVNAARNVQKLAMTMTNWILAHPSENLRVLK